MKTDKYKPITILHGECMITESSIPKTAVVEKYDTPFTIIANSEVTGNHHVIDLEPGVEFFRNGETRYMKNSVPANVRCVIAERHTDVKIPPGEWVIGSQQEYDYFELAMRNVAD